VLRYYATVQNHAKNNLTLELGLRGKTFIIRHITPISNFPRKKCNENLCLVKGITVAIDVNEIWLRE
jgi:hypothetical protein